MVRLIVVTVCRCSVDLETVSDKTFFGDVAILVACPVSRWRNSLTVVHLACLAAEPLEIWVQIQASVACRYMQATLSKINISGRPVYS